MSLLSFSTLPLSGPPFSRLRLSGPSNSAPSRSAPSRSAQSRSRQSRSALLRRALTIFVALILLSALTTALAQAGAQRAVALRAYSSDVLWDDAWTSGSFVRSGATLATHDPAYWLCKPGGCAPAALSDHVGQAVGIVCRRDPEGYLKLYYATDQEPAWASAGDVKAKGPVRACGMWDW
jgi:hypothetical protein